MDSMNRRRRCRQKGDPCRCLRPLIRLWGVTTAIVVCGVGVDITVHGYHAGFYILVASGLVFFCEVKWVITLFIQLFSTNNDFLTPNCAQCWSVCRFVGGWRLSPPYVAFGVALIMWPHSLWLSHVAGAQLILLAVLRVFTIFRYGGSRGCDGRSDGGGKEEGLLPTGDDSFEKTECLSDIVDDAMPAAGKSFEDDDENMADV